ncbi:hypothetical protein OAL14_05775 [Gammaproteobacteria bacterium]|nr:hypothetical protein [Gammaproteobacteria bacterium]
MHSMELKNVEWDKSHSKETHCYRLTVYWEGERVFKASNGGNGEHTAYHSCKDHSKQTFESLFKKVADHCREHVIQTKPAFFEKIVNREDNGNLCVEYLINKLLNDSFILKNMNKTLKSRICLLDSQGRIFSIKMRPLDKTLAFIEKQVENGTYNDFTILNTMSESEKSKHWRASTDANEE